MAAPETKEASERRLELASATDAAEAASIFRYMTGYRIECIAACGKTLACCTLPRLFVWDTDAKRLVFEAEKTVRVTSIVFLNGEPFLVSSRALHDRTLQTVADLEFMSALLAVEGRLVAIGKKYFTVICREEATRREHALDYGVCTGAVLSGQLVYVSFENGRILRVSDILGDPRVTELVSVKEPIVSMQVFQGNLAACVLDSKLLLVDSSTGGFVFTRAEGDLRKVVSAGPYILLLDCEGRLMAFDEVLSFVGILEESAIDVDVAKDTLFIATTKRQIVQCRFSSKLSRRACLASA